MPERLEIVDRFPLAGVGKISKKGLRADIVARLRADVADFIARDQSPGVLASEQVILA